MTTTRLNDSRQIEVLIESLEGYALMVVPAIADGGYTVKLSPDQIASIGEILGQLQGLGTALSDSGELAERLNGLTSKLDSVKSAELAEIITRLGALTSLGAIAQSSGEILTAISDLTEAIGNIVGGGGVSAGVQSIGSVALVNANQQYSYTMPAGTVRYAFSCRGDETRNDPIGTVRFAWAPNKVAPAGGGLGVDEYEILLPENEESADQVFASAGTLYLAGDTPGIVVNVRRWANANP